MEYVGLYLNNMYSNKIFDNVIDEDLAGMYPNLIRAGNIDISTMIGRLFSDCNPILGEMLFDLMCVSDKSELGKQFLNLPNAADILTNIDDYLVE